MSVANLTACLPSCLPTVNQLLTVVPQLQRDLETKEVLLNEVNQLISDSVDYSGTFEVSHSTVKKFKYYLYIWTFRPHLDEDAVKCLTKTLSAFFSDYDNSQQWFTTFTSFIQSSRGGGGGEDFYSILRGNTGGWRQDRLWSFHQRVLPWRESLSWARVCLSYSGSSSLKTAKEGWNLCGGGGRRGKWME